MTHDPLAEGLVYEAMLPFHWSRLPGRPDINALLQACEANETVLQAINVIEGHVLPESPDDHGVLGQEMARLDAKLDLVLDLMGQLLAQQKALPARHVVRLGTAGLAWLQGRESGLKPGVHLLAEVYLQARYPSPLQLSGEVVSTGPDEQGEWITLSYHGLSPGVRDHLDRLIFRHHRRAVALSRAGHAE